MYVLTKSYNDYDQHGDYLETVFEKSPTLTELSNYFYKQSLEQLDDEQLLFLTHVKRGGGRQNNESEWYFLSSLKHSEPYQHSN